MFRSAIFVLLVALFFAPRAGWAQESSSSQAPVPELNQPAAAPQDSPELPPVTAPQPLPEHGAAKPVSDEVSAAEGAIAGSDWKAAEAKLDPWIAAHPADARALFDLGYVADAQNRLDDAVGLYRRAVGADPKSFEAHISLGLLLARMGKPAEARPELAAATTLDPGDAGNVLKARAWRALAQIDRPAAGRAGDTTAASNELLEALKLTPETRDDTMLAAALAEQAGQTDAAEGAYRSILAKDAKFEPANAGLAHILMARKQYPEAEALLRAALEQLPGDLALSAQLVAALAAQDKGEALDEMQKLHAEHPADEDITRMLAELLSEAGDDAGSDKLYAELLKIAPEDPVLLIGHGQNLVRQARYAEGYAAFDKATQLDPANGDGWSGLAFAASRLGRHAEVLHALTMRSKLLPESPSTYFLWATSYDAMHQKAEAVAYYHHFLDSAAGKLPDQEWQARQRLLALGK